MAPLPTSTPPSQGSGSAAPRTGPLVDVRVVDFGQLVAGPMAASLLADYGADVVKVEPPAGDAVRGLAPHKDDVSLWWKMNGRNKRSVCLDLKTARDLETFYGLIRVADIAIENYAVGVTKRLRIDYDTLRTINPSLVMLSISGYGQTGPYSHKRAFGRTAEAYSGLAYTTGYPDRPPVHGAFPIADTVSGVFGALAAVSALHEREHNPTGIGQHIDLALYEAPLRLMEYTAIQYDQLGKVTERGGAETSYVYPVGTWETKDGRFASFTGSTEAMVTRLFEAIGRPDLGDDPRYRTNQDRMANRDGLQEILTSWMRSHTLSEVMEIFDAHNVAIAPYLNIADLFSDPHIQARGNLVPVDDPDFGSVVMQDVVPRFSRTPGTVRHPGRREIGADGEAVVRDWLGDATPAPRSPGR